MNYLAHTLLAEPTTHGLAGSLLGDFWRGAPDPRWPRALTEGVRLHRAVDSATDRHPAFVAMRGLLPLTLRRYAGIALDVAFDHVLTLEWPRFSDISLREHVDAVNAALRGAARDGYVPDDFAHFAVRAADEDLLARYGEIAVLERAFRSLSRRLRRSNPLADAWIHLAPLMPELRAALPPLLADLRKVRPRETCSTA